jgi:hypothetical protein
VNPGFTLSSLAAALGSFSVCLLGTSCVTPSVAMPVEQRAGLERQLAGEDRFLKISMFATPLFGDTSKRLLTTVPPEEVRLIDSTDHKPMNPGNIESLFPAGTRVRLKKVEFPSPWTLTSRVLLTPRTETWLYVDIEGTAKNAPPYIWVVRSTVQDDREFLAHLERYFSVEDPRVLLASFGDTIREAITRKQAVLDMSTQALEMSWGYPETKTVTFVADKRQERWTWPGGKRSAILEEGRVTALPGTTR